MRMPMVKKWRNRRPLAGGGWRIPLLAVLWVVAAPASAADVTVKDIRMWTAPDHTRLVLDLDQHTDYNLFRLQDPARVVVDLAGADGRGSPSDLDLPDPVLKAVRTGHPPSGSYERRGTFRVVMDLKQDVQPKTFLLKPHQEHGHRLVIDLYREEENREKRAARALEKTSDAEFLVAVDAGHGGEDPGAIGPNGLKEKKAVLAIAKRIAEHINQRDGIRAFLTRKGDYFLNLRERIKMARESQADLFLSIHADAFKKRSAKGASVYALSRRGASDEAARWLAEQENQADLAGGVSLDNVDEGVAPVVMDLVQSATIQDSLSLGERILQKMNGVASLHFDDVRQARFVVLKSPDIPSVLVETGFISNPTEARRLGDPDYQRRIARSVAAGSARFLEERDPVPASARAGGASSRRDTDVETYTVSRGDTLWSIAQRHQVSIPKLRQVNNLAGTDLQVGRTLQIP